MGRSENCETCPYPKLSEQNQLDEEAIIMMIRSIGGLQISMMEVLSIFKIPKYRHAEMIDKSIAVHESLGAKK